MRIPSYYTGPLTLRAYLSKPKGQFEDRIAEAKDLPVNLSKASTLSHTHTFSYSNANTGPITLDFTTDGWGTRAPLMWKKLTLRLTVLCGCALCVCVRCRWTRSVCCAPPSRYHTHTYRPQMTPLLSPLDPCLVMPGVGDARQALHAQPVVHSDAPPGVGHYRRGPARRHQGVLRRIHHPHQPGATHKHRQAKTECRPVEPSAPACIRVSDYPNSSVSAVCPPLGVCVCR